MNETQAVEEIARLAQEATGVQLSARHRPMIESRLRRRIDELGLGTMAEYLTYLRAHFAEEKKVLIAQITTHHTYFFREIAHFEYLRDHGLPEAITALRRQGRRQLRVWSAACSRGQEAYSLAMWILPWLKTHAPDVELKIFGSDIDGESVRIAQNGVYAKTELDEVPLSLLGSHWARGTGDIADFVKARASLRDHVEFKEGSLFALPPVGEKYDVIFCRNVFIYFNPEQIKAIGLELEQRLQPHGYLFVGISETLSGLSLGVDSVAPSAYRLKAALKVATPAPASSPAAAPARAASAPATAPAPALVRVLCVDDSPSILAILKKLLSRERGFEVVGTAKSGIEAAARMKQGGVDLVTLDIHMPEMDGLQYLEQHYRAGHPPVVMITSVSRENSGLALRALELGASDYVEKPSLADLNERAEEICFKLKSAVRSGARPADFDRQFERKAQLADPQNCVRLWFCSLSDAPRAAELRRSLTAQDPATVILLEGAGAARLSLAGKFTPAGAAAPKLEAGSFRPGEVYLLEAQESWEKLKISLAHHRVSAFVFGPLSPGAQTRLRSLPAAQVLLEDLGGGERMPFAGRADVWRLPLTSFLYQSFEFFAKLRKAA